MILTFCVMYTTSINFFPFIDVYSRWITTVHGKKKIIQMCNGNPKGIKFQLLILISIIEKEQQRSYMNYGYIILYSIFMHVNLRVYIFFAQ